MVTETKINNCTTYTKEQLKNLLPHREPMLLLDKAEVIDNTAYGQLQITGDEYFLKGHFPDDPIVPGVIQCEILAQSVCVLLCPKNQNSKVKPLFTGLDKVRFKNIVRPGDLFKTECIITSIKEPFYFACGKGFVSGKLCVSAEFSFALIDTCEAAK